MQAAPDAEFLPFEQLPDEDGRAWANFVVYRDLGPERSLAKAVKVTGKATGSLQNQCRIHNWVARCRAWDAECDRQRRAELLKAQRKMVTEHARCAAKVRQLAMQHIDPEDVAKRLALDPDQAIKWLQVAIKIEQTSIGLPTDHTQITTASPDKSADAVYFDSLPRHKFLALAEQAVQTLKKEAP